MLAIIARSSGEKPAAASVARASARSSRIEAAGFKSHHRLQALDPAFRVSFAVTPAPVLSGSGWAASALLPAGSVMVIVYASLPSLSA